MKQGIKVLLATCLVLAGSMLLNIAQACAIDGRDFAGYYELKSVVEQGDIVMLKFSTQVFNFSDADVIGAYVVLDNSLLSETYMVFQSVNIDVYGQVFLSADISVAAWEYQQWLLGIRPNLSVIYQDGSGNTFRRPVELIEMPLGGQS